MNTKNNYTDKYNEMDTSKGQKIVAALYLVTNHLSDNDPLKIALRRHGIGLVDGISTASDSRRSSIDMLLGAAVIAKIISEKNASIIMLELKHFTERTSAHHEDVVSMLFPVSPPVSDISSKRPQVQLSFKETISPHSNRESYVGKGNRQQTILSFIDDRKAASIKDIAALFTDVSEKTIQRELGTLVASGKISKRGSKRWSVYMAVGATV